MFFFVDWIVKCRLVDLFNCFLDVVICVLYCVVVVIFFFGGFFVFCMGIKGMFIVGVVIFVINGFGKV